MSIDQPVTDDEVIGYLARFLDEQGLPATEFGPATTVEELGLDSLHLAELLLTARAELAAEGRLPEDATLTQMPSLTTVADLTAVIQGLGAPAGEPA